MHSAASAGASSLIHSSVGGMHSSSQPMLGVTPRTMQIMDEMKRALTCPQCNDILTEPHSLPCQHHFCEDCISEDLERHSICPVCHVQFWAKDLTPNIMMKKLLQNYAAMRTWLEQKADRMGQQSDSAVHKTRAPDEEGEATKENQQRKEGTGKNNSKHHPLAAAAKSPAANKGTNTSTPSRRNAPAVPLFDAVATAGSSTASRPTSTSAAGSNLSSSAASASVSTPKPPHGPQPSSLSALSSPNATHTKTFNKQPVTKKSMSSNPMATVAHSESITIAKPAVSITSSLLNSVSAEKHQLAESLFGDNSQLSQGDVMEVDANTFQRAKQTAPSTASSSDDKRRTVNVQGSDSATKAPERRLSGTLKDFFTKPSNAAVAPAPAPALVPPAIPSSFDSDGDALMLAADVTRLVQNMDHQDIPSQFQHLSALSASSQSAMSQHDAQATAALSANKVLGIQSTVSSLSPKLNVTQAPNSGSSGPVRLEATPPRHSLDAVPPLVETQSQVAAVAPTSSHRSPSQRIPRTDSQSSPPPLEMAPPINIYSPAPPVWSQAGNGPGQVFEPQQSKPMEVDSDTQVLPPKRSLAKQLDAIEKDKSTENAVASITVAAAALPPASNPVPAAAVPAPMPTQAVDPAVPSSLPVSQAQASQPPSHPSSTLVLALGSQPAPTSASRPSSDTNVSTTSAPTSAVPAAVRAPSTVSQAPVDQAMTLSVPELGTSTSPPPSSCLTKSPLILSFTALTSDQTNRLKAFCSQIGTRLLTEKSDWTPGVRVSHLITRVHPNKSHRLVSRSLKYMQGILTGSWIVSWEWVEASIRHGNWIEETPYEVEGDVSKGPSNAPRTSRSRVAEGQPKLFKGLKLSIHPNLNTYPKDPNVEDVRLLVQLGDGILVPTPSFLATVEANGATNSNVASVAASSSSSALSHAGIVRQSSNLSAPGVVYLLVRSDTIQLHSPAEMQALGSKTGMVPCSIQWLLDSISLCRVAECELYRPDLTQEQKYELAAKKREVPVTVAGATA